MPTDHSAADAAIREAVALAGGLPDGLFCHALRDGRVSVMYQWDVRVPQGWHPIGGRVITLQRTCCTVDEIVAAVREAQALRGGQADE